MYDSSVTSRKTRRVVPHHAPSRMVRFRKFQMKGSLMTGPNLLRHVLLTAAGLLLGLGLRTPRAPAGGPSVAAPGTHVLA